MKKFRMVSFTFGVLALAVMATAQMAVAATVYTNAIGVNFSRGDIDGNVGANPSDQAASVGSGIWNNVPYSGPNSGLVDSNGVDVSGISFTISNDNMYTLDATGSYGQPGPGGPAGTLGNSGFGSYDNSTVMTITGIPYASFDIAMSTGWYENIGETNIYPGGIGTRVSEQFGLLGTGTVSGNTFTWTTKNGGSIRAIQILEIGAGGFNGIGTWAGTGPTWSSSASWVTPSLLGSVPGIPSSPLGTAKFDLSGSDATTVELATGEKATLKALSFSGTNYTITGGSLDLQVSTGTAATVTVDAGIKASILSDIIGTTLIEKDGSGTLVLSGSNSFAGTVVKAGTLGVASSSALPEDKPLTVGAGGTLIFAPASSFAGAVIAGTVTTAGAVAAVPEPSTFALLFAGLMVGFGLLRKKK